MADQAARGKVKKGSKKGKSGKAGASSLAGGGGESLMKRLNIGKIYKGSKKKTQGEEEKKGKKNKEGEGSGKEDSVKTSIEDISPPQESSSLEQESLETSKEEEGIEEMEVIKDESFSDVVQDDPGGGGEEGDGGVSSSSTQEFKEDLQDKPEGNEEDEPKTATAATPSSYQEAVSGGGGAKRECLYKILVIGELGTGKTSIIKRYVHQFFSQHYRATIGVDFALKVINWDQNTIIRLQLWDIAGQERFGNMTRVYYKEAVGAFIVFDVTRVSTFEAVMKWKQDLDSKVQLSDGSPIPCVLLANKCDQQKEGLVNHSNKMDEYCKENNFTAWYETSAKENINIDEAAKTLVAQILNNDTSSENGRSGMKDTNRFPLEGNIGSGIETKSCSC